MPVEMGVGTIVSAEPFPEVRFQDYKIANDCNAILKGEDAQLKKAEDVLLGR